MIRWAIVLLVAMLVIVGCATVPQSGVFSADCSYSTEADGAIVIKCYPTGMPITVVAPTATPSATAMPTATATRTPSPSATPSVAITATRVTPTQLPPGTQIFGTNIPATPFCSWEAAGGAKPADKQTFYTYTDPQFSGLLQRVRGGPGTDYNIVDYLGKGVRTRVYWSIMRGGYTWWALDVTCSRWAAQLGSIEEIRD